MKIRDLGFDKWFEDHSDELHQEGCSFARISAVDRGSYLIRRDLCTIQSSVKPDRELISSGHLH